MFLAINLSPSIYTDTDHYLFLNPFASGPRLLFASSIILELSTLNICSFQEWKALAALTNWALDLRKFVNCSWSLTWILLAIFDILFFCLSNHMTLLISFSIPDRLLYSIIINVVLNIIKHILLRRQK